MPRKDAVHRAHFAGIAKAKTDEVSAAIGDINLRSIDATSATSSLKSRARRNAVFASAIATESPLQSTSQAAIIAAECAVSNTRVLSDASSACAAAVNIHVEALSHGTPLTTLSRGTCLRTLRRCFLFTDVGVGVMARMCSHARQMHFSQNTVLQPSGSECASAYIAFDGAFSSNGSGTATSCMLACEESFVLGRMTCASAVTLLHSSQIAIFPAHCFATCAALQGQFEASLIRSVAAEFGRDSLSLPAFRFFVQPTRTAISISGRAFESMRGLPQQQPCLGVAILIVYGECLARCAESKVVTLRAGAVIHTNLASVRSSGLAQDVDDFLSSEHISDLETRGADESIDRFPSRVQDALTGMPIVAFELGDEGCEFLLQLL